MTRSSWMCLGLCGAALAAAAATGPEVSGIYPHLATFNEEGECGTGAVVPWADRLWVVSYAPHAPKGSTDKLYEITPDLRQIIRPESVGGTPANRMIHDESGQLFIGPYAIDSNRTVRVIPYAKMPGRPTGNARHLKAPADKIYYATMEEGFYEVDVRTLAVTTLYPDVQDQAKGGEMLPGYHGKGFYSGQGRLVYANNGERSSEAQSKPFIPSGCLAEWDGQDWKVIRRNQFTEVTGPGGIHGNPRPGTDPLWAVGWDHRSLLLMLRDGGAWRAFRLPKGSHSYDGAHGWNTEWPRIREIGERDLLMTMHGLFWRFPRTFSAANTAGIAPRSAYLKVIGDFCRWQDRIVCGCDDTAKSEFLNKRRAKGAIAAPQSQSNLWFLEPARLDDLGPPLGRGGVWVEEDVAADTPSDPYLVAGFDRRLLHLAHGGSEPAVLRIEVDERGDGTWTAWTNVTVEASGYRPVELPAGGVWARVRSDRPLTRATAWFHLARAERRGREADRMFDGLARPGDARVLGGLLRARGENKRTLGLAAVAAGPGGAEETGYYELGADLVLRRVEDPAAHDFLKKNAAIPAGVLSADAASVVFVDDAGRRYRLPRGDAALDREGPLGPERVAREVATERDLFNAHGTFYELPAENAGGFAKVRPVCTHNRRVYDYCSYRGLFVASGLAADAGAGNPHVIRAADGKAAVWVGAIDDIWRLGKPVGRGGPWKDTAVKAGERSDPYLMTGYDRKTLELAHDAATSVTVRVEVDVTGDRGWKTYAMFTVPAGQSFRHEFPAAYQAYWVRCTADTACRATAQLAYD